MAWSLGPTAVRCRWTVPGARSSPDFKSLFEARSHNVSGDLAPSTPEAVRQCAPRRHASSKPAAHRQTRSATYPIEPAAQDSNIVHGGKGHSYGAGSVWRSSGRAGQTFSTWRREPHEKVTAASTLAASAAGPEAMTPDQHRQTLAQQPPCQLRAVAPSIESDGFQGKMHHQSASRGQKWLPGRGKQQRHNRTGQTGQGPDALMRSIMDASTLSQLYAVLQGELQLASSGACMAPSAGAMVAATSDTTTLAATSSSLTSATLTQMRPIHVAAAIVRLSKLPYKPSMPSSREQAHFLPQPPEDLGSQRLQLLGALLELACAQAGALTARQLVNVIWALGRMEADKNVTTAAAAATAGDDGKANTAGIQLEPVTAVQVPSLTQIKILVSELLGQRVQLQWRVDVADLQRLAGEKEVAEEEELRMASDVDALNEGGSAAGLAKDRMNVEVVDARPQRQRSRKLDQASNREVANLAWAAAQLRLQSPLLWTAVRSVTVQRLRNGNAQQRTRAAAGRGDSTPGVFNTADLANLAWALARAPPLPPQQKHVGGFLAEGLVRAAVERMEDFDAVSLSGLIWGLGTLADNFPAPHPAPGAASHRVLSTEPLDQLESTPAMAAVWVNGIPASDSRGDGTGRNGGGGAGSSAVGHSDDWVTRSDLLPLLLHRAVPRVVLELSQQRMGPQEVVSVALGLAAAARRPGGGAPVPSALLQVLADHVASNATAYVGGRGNEQGARLDNLANVLLALVRCVEGSDGGLNTDPRVARRVERALGAASKQVIRNLPRTSPESLAALAVVYSNQVTGRGGGGAGSTFDSCMASAVTTAGAEAAGAPSDFIAATSSGLLPPPPSTPGTVIPQVRATVLRATLRAAVRLLPALPISTSPSSVSQPLGSSTKPGASVAALKDGGGAGGCSGSSGGGSGRGSLSVRHIREVVGVLWWCAQGLCGGAEGIVEELRAAAPWIEQALPLCRPADLALLAAAYTRAGCHPPSLEAALSAAVRATAPALSPLDVSQLAWAAAASTSAPAAGARDALLLSVLEQRCTELLRSGAWRPGQELAVVLWAFAKLNHYSEPLLNAVAEVIRTASAAPATPSLLRGLHPQEVAMMAAALGHLRYYDAQMLRLLASCVEADVDRYSARVLTWALSAFASLNSHHPGLLHAATARVRQLLQSHPHPSSIGLPFPHHDHTRLQPQAQNAEEVHTGSRQGLVSEHVQADGGTPPLSPFDAVALLWSFGVLQHVDMDCIRGLIRILPRDPRAYSISDLSRLGLADAMLRGALVRCKGRHVRTPHDYAAKSGGGGGAASTAANAAALASGTGSGGIDGGGRSSLDEEDLTAVALQGGLLPEQLQEAVVRTAGSQRSRVSNLQREVAAVLRGMGLRPKLEVAMGVFSLDLRLDLPEGWKYTQLTPEQQQQQEEEKRQVPPQQRQARQSSRREKGSGGGGGPIGSAASASGSGGDGGDDTHIGPHHGRPGPSGALVRIAVEVDGPSHFCANVTNHALGATVARDRCLLDQGLQLVVVPHFEWHLLQSPEAKRSYLARRLASAAAQPHDDDDNDGHHHNHHHSEGAVAAGVAGGCQQKQGGRVTRRRTNASRALFPAITVTSQVVRHGSLPIPTPAAVIPTVNPIAIATVGSAVADAPAATRTLPTSSCRQQR